ncbi:hypothetical protein F441_03479 [Phytophthora nicotianae CJ01A1]|uniref:Uncharacterized protein n=4 Tax=Phytophthora nicotianae TaxID=4792 RepID=W2QM36_PHYN3|nr:hypothetical protein PPTG_08346 [Phytophthora nicotianae INRA-310]ETI53589.1 hypothetical protein F443_03501 [Phytophthora nicotianae P1569]ETK93453.1 hypothetical protein L915_03388 [Phytophthora nicotianae]ETP23388.1 hypothetical protein F441_03479 [Phytophthora nicotianae CJ01A1]ETL46869.1 hypothetical protein L916_03324 [Phytophthora nicotianae]ETN13584.1 hypothetical protein PPTG_08346 [Phytophthora nicotianae INRA-310]
MRTVADVSTDDLVNSLLNSVTTGGSSTSSTTSTTPSTATTSSTTTSSTSATRTSAPSTASATASSSASASHSASSSSNDASPATDTPETTSPVTTAPATTAPSPADSSSTGAGDTATKGTTEDSDDSGGGGAGLSIGIALGVLALVIAALLFLRSRRKRAQKERESASSPPAGATCLAVPAGRGFKKEQELGLPEMSIELTPGELGMSKGFDMSYASSTRSSATSQPYNPSLASSTDSSVFNTRGGVSPTFSNRKMASYSYQYRESEENGNANPNMSSARSNDSTTFHLTGLIGNGATASGRGPSNQTRGRKLSAPDEYAELVTATNAHGQVDMNAHNQTPQTMHADFTQSATSQNEMNISMGPDNDNHSFLAPLPTRPAPAPAPRPAPTIVRASEESMGPDSPVARGKRTGSVYDTIPNLAGEKMSASASTRSSVEDPNAMSTASFLSESSISSTSTRDSVATSARGSAYVSSMPLLQQLSSADDSDYGEDMSSERASTESSDSANTTRSGSLIALNLEAKDGCSEIAI